MIIDNTLKQVQTNREGHALMIAALTVLKKATNGQLDEVKDEQIEKPKES